MAVSRKVRKLLISPRPVCAEKSRTMAVAMTLDLALRESVNHMMGTVTRMVTTVVGSVTLSGVNKAEARIGVEAGRYRVERHIG